MRIHVLAVGRVKGPLASGVAHYRARAERYWTLDVREIREGRGERNTLLEAEAVGIARRRTPHARLWVLTRGGRPWSSADWARRLERLSREAHPTVDIVLGGAWGVAPDLIDQADRRVSLSRATLPHDLARLVLFEQLYRAGTILRGEPYHKGANS